MFFAYPLAASLLIQVPGLFNTALGVGEAILAAGLAGLVARIDVPRWRRERDDPLSWRLSHIAPPIVVVSLAIVGAVDTVTTSFGGLYWLAAATAVVTATGIINSWGPARRDQALTHGPALTEDASRNRQRRITRACSRASHALAAPIARAIAPEALAALGLSGDPGGRGRHGGDCLQTSGTPLASENGPTTRGRRGRVLTAPAHHVKAAVPDDCHPVPTCPKKRNKLMHLVMAVLGAGVAAGVGRPAR